MKTKLLTVSYFDVIINLPSTNISLLQRKTNINSYAYLLSVINSLEKENIVKTEKENRSRKILLTEKGKKLKVTIKTLYEILGYDDL